ncbi:MAG: HAD family hydrolase [Desulfovibrio sp.]
MRFKAFFFDFDGVLADSEEVKTQAFSELFRQYGPDVMTRVAKHQHGHFGMNRYDNLRYYYSNFLGLELSQEQLDAECARFSALVVDAVSAAAEIPGARDFLERYTPRVPAWVISNVPQDEVRHIAARRGIAPFFQDIHGAPASKEENAGKLLDRLGLSPENVLFFGDSLSDLKAARTTGTKFLGILPGPDAPLLQKAPDITWVLNFRELLDAPSILEGV